MYDVAVAAYNVRESGSRRQNANRPLGQRATANQLL